jgi:hypothetical protein
MVKAVGVLGGVRGHKDAGTKKSIGESCRRRALLELSLNVLQGAIVVNGELEPVFQVLEEAGYFWGTGIKWEAFCPEYRATLDGVVHVFQELSAVARGGLGGIVWRDGCTD